jgi:hypothetical protein
MPSSRNLGRLHAGCPRPSSQDPQISRQFLVIDPGKTLNVLTLRLLMVKRRSEILPLAADSTGRVAKIEANQAISSQTHTPIAGSGREIGIAVSFPGTVHFSKKRKPYGVLIPLAPRVKSDHPQPC